MSLDAYWDNYEACLNDIAANGSTVDEVMTILKKYHERSSTEAFCPDGGERNLPGVLTWERNDWTTVWAEAWYYCCLRDSNGDLLSYIEGDVARGNCQSRTESPA